MEIVTSKAIGIQLLRHRSFTFQEFSQRYAEVTSVEPIELRRRAEKNRQSSEDVFDPLIDDPFGKVFGDITPPGEDPPLCSAMDLISEYVESGLMLYKKLLSADVAKECARMILPMATTTTIHMSGTIRSWIHMIDIRDEEHAQKEAQIVARAAKDVFIKQLPETSKALGWTQ
jgi:thymidylate synthase (FAD)